MKNFLIACLAAMFITVGCAGVKYNSTEVHQKMVETQEFPQMLYPPEAQVFIDEVEANTKADGVKLTYHGCVVSDDGSYVILLSVDVDDVVVGFVFNSYHQLVGMIDIDTFWKMYQDICITNQYCNKNPYTLNAKK